MKRKTWIFFAVLLIYVLIDHASGFNGGTGKGQKAEEEILHGTTVDLETISIDVASNGCTTNEDFMFLVGRHRRSIPEVTVIRINPDLCKGFVRNVTLVFKRKDVGLGIDFFTIKNPFRGFPRF
jgi:hypothetical protein